MPVSGGGTPATETGASAIGAGDRQTRQPADGASDREKKPTARGGVGDGSKARVMKSSFAQRTRA